MYYKIYECVNINILKLLEILCMRCQEKERNFEYE